MRHCYPRVSPRSAFTRNPFHFCHCCCCVFSSFFFFLICLQAQLNICSIPLVLIMYSKNPYRHNLTAHQRADSCAFLISHIISCVFVTFSFIIQTQKRQFKCGSGDLPRPRILFFNKGGVQSIILKVPDWKGIEPGIFS